MNFVVGVILIGIVDPEGDGFGDDSAKNQAIIQYAMTSEWREMMIARESQSQIEKQTFGVTMSLIRILHMQGLWSAGIPDLKRFIFILQQYMKCDQSVKIRLRTTCPSILNYFDQVGYDVSIIVSKWFITLFSYVCSYSDLVIDRLYHYH